MFAPTIFLTFVVIAAARGIHKVPHHGRIVGGKNADILDYPHQISLQYKDQHFCGGSIISEKFIVTAGHCTYGFDEESLSIRANTSILGEGGVVIDVEKVNRHPSYDPVTVDYDISVLELKSPLKFGPGIQAISLPKFTDSLPDNTSVFVTGWGVTGEYISTLSKQLQVVEVSTINKDVCVKEYVQENLVTDRMFCAGALDGGKDSCQGDSGGPLVANNVLYGIVSWGYGCAESEFPGVYGSVTVLRKYITEITNL